ncbi:MAG TPA: DUF1206 domain-containing protein [Actinoplanes sp.]|nr:DUF1206 domain-containing protein [Actinoplanes sp.]
MSVGQHALSTADRAADSKTLEWFTRGGFVGYGVVHLLVAWLVSQIAFGRSTGAGDQSGALRELAGQPLGRFLVIATVVGLAAMAIWQAFEAAIGHRGDTGRVRVGERLMSLGRVGVYLYFALTGYKVQRGARSSSADSQQQASEHLMAQTGGRWLVGLIALLVMAVGTGLAVYGYQRRFEKHLHVDRMSAAVHRVCRRLGVLGYLAKGIAYAIAGALLMTAAVAYEPDKARGLDATVRTLAEQPYGGALLAAMAAGIAAYGVFCLIQARYRKV